VCTDAGCLGQPGATFPAVQQAQTRDGYYIYFSTDIGPTVAALITYITAQNDSLVDLRVERPTLEDRFLEITAKEGAG
jgi:ABC-2 type transport system ATP-binding protein